MQRLKIVNIYYLTVSLGYEPGCLLSWVPLAQVSHDVASNFWVGAEGLMGGGTSAS